MRHVVIALALLGLTACGGGSGGTKPSTFAKVEYLVTGTAGATRASVTYATSGGGTAQGADRVLPWSFDTTMSAGDFVYISAQNGGSSGCVNVEIRVRSTYYKSTQSCGAFVIATASGSVE